MRTHKLSSHSHCIGNITLGYDQVNRISESVVKRLKTDQAQ